VPGEQCRSGTIIAFDFGEKRIGVAVGDLAVGIAHPLTTISGEDNRTRFAAIAALIDEWRPVRLVVGVPAHPDGAEHAVARLARRFAERLAGRFRLPVRLVDERLTSQAAESKLREQGARTSRRKAALDAAAAREILQSYFDTAGCDRLGPRYAQ
jgi:putative holliday junction resolvase